MKKIILSILGVMVVLLSALSAGCGINNVPVPETAVDSNQSPNCSQLSCQPPPQFQLPFQLLFNRFLLNLHHSRMYWCLANSKEKNR